jgi:hypothetical protein
MGIRARAAGAAAVGLTVALGLAACGGGSDPAPSSAGSSSPTASETPAAEPDKPSAKDLFQDAKTAALAAKSGHLKGSVMDNGDLLEIDLAGTADGSNQELTMTNDGATATIRTVDGKTWMSADEKFWTDQGAPAETAKQLVGKFTPIEASQAAALGDLTLGALLQDMLKDEGINALQSMVIDVTEGTVGSTPAWVMGDKEGQVFFSAETNELLRMVSESNGDLTFSEWNAVKPFKAPAKKDVFTP